MYGNWRQTAQKIPFKPLNKIFKKFFRWKLHINPIEKNVNKENVNKRPNIAVKVVKTPEKITKMINEIWRKNGCHHIEINFSLILMR